MYLHVSTKLKMGVPFGQFKALVDKIKPTFEKHGWRLEKGLVSITGRVNSVVNIWHVPDAAALQAGLFDPDLRRNIAEVHEIVEDEVVNLMMPYTPDK